MPKKLANLSPSSFSFSFSVPTSPFFFFLSRACRVFHSRISSFSTNSCAGAFGLNSGQQLAGRTFLDWANQGLGIQRDKNNTFDNISRTKGCLEKRTSPSYRAQRELHETRTHIFPHDFHHGFLQFLHKSSPLSSTAGILYHRCQHTGHTNLRRCHWTHRSIPIQEAPSTL